MVNPSNGEAMALLGGFDYNTSQFNRAISSKRQVGSTMKPFLYYAALESGFTSASSFISEKTTFNFSNNKTYSPKNYNDKYANGPISMGTALAYSDNIYAVKTHLFLGEEVLVETLKRVGIETKLKAIPSLALGSEGISLVEMTRAYLTLANNGYKIKPHLIKKIEDYKGNTLYEFKEKKEQVLNSSITYIVNEMLTSTYNYNFIDYNYPSCYDIASKLENKFAIKTGTTDSDHLIFGYNKDIVVGIWSGMDDNSKSESSNGTYIKKMFASITNDYFKNKKTSWYKLPNNVVGVLVNPISGELASKDTKNAPMFYYIKGTEPGYNNTSVEDLIPTIKQE